MENTGNQFRCKDRYCKFYFVYHDTKGSFEKVNITKSLQIYMEQLVVIKLTLDVPLSSGKSVITAMFVLHQCGLS